MPDQLQEPAGCIRDAAAGLAVAGWTAGMVFLFPLLGWNKWLAVFIGATTLGLWLLLWAVASHLGRIAGARYLERVETQNLLEIAAAGVPTETTGDES